MSRWLKRQGTNGFIDLCIMIVSVIVVLMIMQPSLIFSNSILTGGDYGGHLDIPYFVLMHLLPKGQITGWSPDWYNGWPVNVFYFPLPSLMVALLSIVLPYSVAFKLIISLGPILLPFAVWTVGRSARLPNPMPSMMSVAMVSYLINQSYTIDGGNIFSTLAGEYSFSISLLFCLFFFAALIRWYRTSKGAFLCAALFIGATMSHLLGALLCVVITLVAVFIFNHPKTYVSVFLRSLLVGTIASISMAFWAFPFSLNLAYTTNMGYQKIVAYYQYLTPFDYRWVILLLYVGIFFALYNNKNYILCVLMLGITGAGAVFFPLYVCLLIASAVFSLLLWFKRPVTVIFMIIGLISALGFRFLPFDSKLYNARLLPTYALSIYALAGIGFGEIAIACANGFKSIMGNFRPHLLIKKSNVVRGVVGVLIALCSLLIVVETTFGSETQGTVSLPIVGYVSKNNAESWVNWNFTGYQAKPSYKEFAKVINTMKKVGSEYGCGRAFWEYSPSLDRFGTPMALMLLPYFTNNCIDSEEGLFFESSATTPFHFINQAELSEVPDYAMQGLTYGSTEQDVTIGVEHLQMMGVRYLMVSSPQINRQALINPSLTLIDTIGPFEVPPGFTPPASVRWYVYKVAKSQLVRALKYNPVVLDKIPPANPPTIGSWTTAAQSWYLDPADWRIEVAASGPNAWKKISAYKGELSPTRGVDLTSLKEPRLAPVKITNVSTSLSSISFNVNKIGVPVEVKISYFPNWQAKNAVGPYRIFPNQMVVIPTSKHVTLFFGPKPIDWIEYFLSGLGLVGLILIIKLSPKNRKYYGRNLGLFERGAAVSQSIDEAFDKIFKAYDVRGLCPEDLDETMARAIGYGFAKVVSSDAIVVARDMRPTGNKLIEAFCEGVTSLGVTVINIGLASTDMLYFASGFYDVPGAMFTASHNPAQYNGIKMCGPKASPIGEETGLLEIKVLAKDVLKDDLILEGDIDLIGDSDLLDEFVKHVRSFVSVTDFGGMKVVADTANGMGGLIVPAAFQGMGVELEILYPELDGTFPNHPADPIQEENQRDLIDKVLETKADVGLAFDGDADRVFLVDDLGQPLSGSITTALVADSMLKKYPGATVLHNLICSKVVPETILSNGGRAVRTRVGHSFIKKTMAETNAVFGGEHSGHYYFKDNYRADSGLIAAFIIVELILLSGKKLSELRKPFEKYFASGERNVTVKDTVQILDGIENYFAKSTVSIDRLDGITLDFDSWWVNIRPSNTEPLLRINLEADTYDNMMKNLDDILKIIEDLDSLTTDKTDKV